MIPAETLKQIFDPYDEGVLIINKDLTFEYINPMANKIVGVEFERKLGEKGEGYYGLCYNNSNEKIPEDEFPALKALQGEYVNNQELVLKNPKNPDGRTLSVTASPISNENGDIERAIVLFRDISKFTKNEERLEEDKLTLECILRQRTEKLELINKILNISIGHKEIYSFFEIILKELCLYLRYDTGHLYEENEGSLVYSDLYYFHNSQDINKVKKYKEKNRFNPQDGALGQSYREGKPILIEDLSKHHDCPYVGEFIGLGVESLLALPILGDGKVPFVIVFFSNHQKVCGENKDDVDKFLIDLSQIIGNSVHRFQREENLLKQNNTLEEKIEEKDKILQELSKVKEEFIAKIGHELRTPLNAIIGYTEMSTEDVRTKNYADLSDYFEKITGSANNLLGMVTNLINISNISSTSVLKTSLDPFKFLSELEIAFQSAAKESNNKLLTTYGQQTGVIRTDAEKLKVVISNIVRNACKYTKNGEIHISVDSNYESEIPEAIFAVKDTGCGIDTENFQEIFDSFTQTDNTHTRKFDGMGVGLHLSKLYADMIGARIEVESEKGKGSTFKVYVPLR